MCYFGQLSEDIGLLAVAHHGKRWVGPRGFHCSGCYQPALSHSDTELVLHGRNVIPAFQIKVHIGTQLDIVTSQMESDFY